MLERRLICHAPFPSYRATVLLGTFTSANKCGWERKQTLCHPAIVSSQHTSYTSFLTPKAGRQSIVHTYRYSVNTSSDVANLRLSVGAKKSPLATSKTTRQECVLATTSACRWYDLITCIHTVHIQYKNISVTRQDCGVQ